MWTARVPALVCLLSTVSTVRAACLEGAVPPAELLWITDDTGREIPIGLLEAKWDSNRLFTRITQILIEEVIGYHTMIGVEAAGNGGVAHAALAGCVEGECEETRLHIHVDSWMSNHKDQEQQIKDAHPHLQALDLGSMGYSGVEGFYVTKQTFTAAYDAEGLALNFYLSFNRSHHNARLYLDGVADVSTELLKLCKDSDFYNSEHMASYLRWTGDEGGLVQQDSGHVAKCLDGYFWLAPSCRDDPPMCALAITAVTGWGMRSFMQSAAAYGIPAALAVAKTWQDEINIVKDLRCLFYWYEPDVSFVQMEPSLLIFPTHSAQEWAEGKRTTASPSTYVNKACSANLPLKAPKVTEFLSMMSFGMKETQKMLGQVAGGLSFRETACSWVRENRARWQPWSAATSRCKAGFGLADSEGNFLVSPNDQKTVCQQCSAGRFSTSASDGNGTWLHCAKCQLGYFQSKSGMTLCEPCARGTYDNSSDPSSGASCTVCPIGSYQSQEAMETCEACPNERTTLLLAAKSLEDCVCKAGTIEGSAGCVECSEGLACPKGSTVQLLLDGDGSEGKPSVEPGYFSSRDAPLAIYKCNSYCPGGSPGTCSAGRVGLACGECPWRTFIQEEECRPCQDAVRVVWFLAGPTILLIVFSSYYAINKPHPVKATALSCVFACGGLLVVFCEIMAVVQSVAVPWPPSLEMGLKVFEIFGLNLDSIGFGCVAGTRVKSYRVESLFIPMVVVASLVMYLVSNLHSRCERWAWDLPGTLNMLGHFLQEGFITMSQIGMIPFSCFSHPNGQKSLLTAPNVICGSADQSTMQGFAGILGLFTFGFLAACGFAAWKAPSWSAKPERLRCIRFLIERFRPDVWWYGTVLLIRGPLLTMPAIVAANVPGLQMTGILGIMLISVLIQVRVLPWNAPLVNAADALSSSFLLILLAIGLARLDPGGRWASEVLDIASMVVAALMAVVWVLVMMAVAVLLCRKTFLGREDSRIINLAKSKSTRETLRLLTDIASCVLEHPGHPDKKTFDEQLSQSLDELSVYDFQQLYAALQLLRDDLGLGSDVPRSSRSSGDSRIRHSSGIRFQSTIRASRRSVVHEDVSSPPSTATPEPSPQESPLPSTTEEVKLEDAKLADEAMCLSDAGSEDVVKTAC